MDDRDITGLDWLKVDKSYVGLIALLALGLNAGALAFALLIMLLSALR